MNHKTYQTVLVSNSTVLEPSFNFVDKELEFTVTGESGTTSFCIVTIPLDLIGGQLSVFKDGSLLVNGVDYIQFSNETHNVFEMNFNNSAHDFRIVGEIAVPEFSSFIIVISLMATITAIITIYKKKPMAHCRS